jgi:hypothetical protein
MVHSDVFERHILNSAGDLAADCDAISTAGRDVAEDDILRGAVVAPAEERLEWLQAVVLAQRRLKSLKQGSRSRRMFTATLGGGWFCMFYAFEWTC